jgi:hypothetical protein
VFSLADRQVLGPAHSPRLSALNRDCGLTDFEVGDYRPLDVGKVGRQRRPGATALPRLSNTKETV